MKPKVIKLKLISVFLLLLSSCVTTPAHWAKNLSNKLHCGMSVTEVEKIANKPLLEVNRIWGTHMIGEETERTMVALTFENQGLRYIQIIWSEAFIGLGVPQREPKIDLC